jgi:hypothetical protein
MVLDQICALVGSHQPSRLIPFRSLSTKSKATTHTVKLLINHDAPDKKVEMGHDQVFGTTLPEKGISSLLKPPRTSSTNMMLQYIRTLLLR